MAGVRTLACVAAQAGVEMSLAWRQQRRGCQMGGEMDFTKRGLGEGCLSQRSPQRLDLIALRLGKPQFRSEFEDMQRSGIAVQFSRPGKPSALAGLNRLYIPGGQ